MKCYVVLVSVDHPSIDARPACESFEGTVFTADELSSGYTPGEAIQRAICGQLKIEPSKDVEVWPIDDFMDLVNDECFNPDNYFMSYVYRVVG